MNLPLNTAFTESHRFWVVVLSFSFISMHILLSFLMDFFLNADCHSAVPRNIWNFETLASLTSSYSMLPVPSSLCEKQVLKDHGSSWQVACMCAQLCLTLWDPMDCSSPCSSVHGIFQVGIKEWVAISSSRGSSQLRDWTQVSCIADRRFTLWATREDQIVQN